MLWFLSWNIASRSYRYIQVKINEFACASTLCMCLCCCVWVCLNAFCLLYLFFVFHSGTIWCIQSFRSQHYCFSFLCNKIIREWTLFALSRIAAITSNSNAAIVAAIVYDNDGETNSYNDIFGIHFFFRFLFYFFVLRVWYTRILDLARYQSPFSRIYLVFRFCYATYTYGIVIASRIYSSKQQKRWEKKNQMHGSLIRHAQTLTNIWNAFTREHYNLFCICVCIVCLCRKLNLIKVVTANDPHKI